MLTTIVIGHLGADAEQKNSNGNEFVTFRVAHTDKWTDDAGQTHENTTWIDCIINGSPKVLPYLKKGQMVYVSGSLGLRVYSSPKERCMKAGATISVKQIELLGGRQDDVPSVLYSEDGQTEYRVGKFFYAPSAAQKEGEQEKKVLVSKSGERYVADKDGWVLREQATPES